MRKLTKYILEKNSSVYRSITDAVGEGASNAFKTLWSGKNSASGDIAKAVRDGASAANPTPNLSRYAGMGGKALAVAGVATPGALYARSLYGRLDQDQRKATTGNEIMSKITGTSTGYFPQSQLSSYRNNGVS